MQTEKPASQPAIQPYISMYHICDQHANVIFTKNVYFPKIFVFVRLKIEALVESPKVFYSFYSTRSGYQKNRPDGTKAGPGLFTISYHFVLLVKINVNNKDGACLAVSSFRTTLFQNHSKPTCCLY